MDEMPDNSRKNDRIPTHDTVLSVLEDKIEEPCNRGGFPSFSAGRLHVFESITRQVPSHPRSLSLLIDLAPDRATRSSIDT